MPSSKPSPKPSSVRPTPEDKFLLERMIEALSVSCAEVNSIKSALASVIFLMPLFPCDVAKRVELSEGVANAIDAVAKLEACYHIGAAVVAAGEEVGPYEVHIKHSMVRCRELRLAVAGALRPLTEFPTTEDYIN